jgi:hypothetical protein
MRTITATVGSAAFLAIAPGAVAGLTSGCGDVRGGINFFLTISAGISTNKRGR